MHERKRKTLSIRKHQVIPSILKWLFFAFLHRKLLNEDVMRSWCPYDVILYSMHIFMRFPLENVQKISNFCIFGRFHFDISLKSFEIVEYLVIQSKLMIK